MGLLLGTAVAVAQGQGATGVKVNPETMQKKAQSPPPANATETSSVGNNVKMARPTGSVSLAEQLDVDGDGQVDQATLDWDGEDRSCSATPPTASHAATAPPGAESF